MNLTRLSTLAILAIRIAAAQPGSAEAVITHIEGKVYRDEKPVEIPTVLNGTSLIRTEDGRAEIHLRSGTLFLGENSAVRVIDNRPYSYNRLEMVNGSAVIATGDNSGLITCEDPVTLSDDGVFRLDLHAIPGSQYGENSCRVRVYQGAASAQLATSVVVLKTGKTMSLNRRAGDMIPRNDFDTADIDGLDRWSREKRN